MGFSLQSLGILLMISTHSIWFVKNEIKALVFGDPEQMDYRRDLSKYVLLEEILGIKYFLFYDQWAKNIKFLDWVLVIFLGKWDQRNENCYCG